MNHPHRLARAAGDYQDRADPTPTHETKVEMSFWLFAVLHETTSGGGPSP
jgi:hypothetical protein